MYTCPMHPEVRQEGPGSCPKCGMDLVMEGSKPKESKTSFSDFYPLIGMFAIVIAFTGVRQSMLESYDAIYGMQDFMAAFFIIFGLLKVVNIKKFAEAYASYDLIAAKSRAYGLLYPFLELGLGAAYFFRFSPLETNIVTLILMTVGSIGVADKLIKKQKIVCACLGAVFKVPMTWVTFTEDILMAVMAAIMIFNLI